MSGPILAGALLALPGGVGTAEEFFEALDSVSINGEAATGPRV